VSFERIEPGTTEWDAYFASHIHRYHFAAQRLLEHGSRKILDAACGVGYGSHHLASTMASEVIGVDRDEHALAIANRDFQRDNVRFILDDCETLREACKHGPFDAVVSFETLEHLKQPSQFLSAVRDLLKPDGSAIVSIPNSDVASSADWEFHERDFNAGEFEEILTNADFCRLDFHGQYMNSLGRLREQIRAEANRIRFNPSFRLGAWLQKRLRNHHLPPPLPEQIEDFEMHSASPEEIRRQGKHGPIAIIVVAARA